MDFPHTRTVIDQLPVWVDAFASLLPKPIKVPGASSFRWEHPSKDVSTVQVAKAVRMASGLRAAIILADERHTVECCVVLRAVADFAAEITFLGEGLLEGRITKEQQKFIDQHFVALPSTPEEFAELEREYYIGRKSIAKAFKRINEKARSDQKLFANISAYLNKGYDSYVHGSYTSAMELFTGKDMTFMLRGSESPVSVCMCKAAVAGKLKEGLNALGFMAMTREMSETARELRSAFERIDVSGEDAGAPCAGL